MSAISKKLTRIKTKRGRFPDDGNNGIGVLDLLALPKNTHLTCPSCSNVWWNISPGLLGFDTGCSGCGWESKINIHTNAPSHCPKCGSNEFAIMKLGSVLGIGCKRCSWQTEQDINNTTPSGIILS